MEGQEGMLQQAQTPCQAWQSGRRGNWWDSVGWEQGERAATPVQVSTVGAAAIAHEQAMECSSCSFL